MKFTIPAPKKDPKKEQLNTVPYCDTYIPILEIPVSREIVSSLEVGKEVTFVVTGLIKGLEARDSINSRSKNEVRLEPRSVEYNPPASKKTAIKKKMVGLFK